MADIDKSLPNQPEVTVEDQKTIEVDTGTPVEPQKDIEVTETLDGGAEISFDPNAIIPQSSNHTFKI